MAPPSRPASRAVAWRKKQLQAATEGHPAAASAAAAPGRQGFSIGRFFISMLFVVCALIVAFVLLQMYIQHSTALSSCQVQLAAASARCAAGNAEVVTGGEGRTLLGGGAACRPIQSALDKCQDAESRCRDELSSAGTAAGGASEEVSRVLDACNARRKKLERALISCEKQLEASKGSLRGRVKVRRENSDILDMDPPAMAREIERLRMQVRLLTIEKDSDLQPLKNQIKVYQDIVTNMTSEQIRTSKRLARLEQQLDRTHTTDLATMGYRCRASEGDMRRYLNFTVGGSCPNDWFVVQRLIFRHECFALPRRRCRAVTPQHPREPLPTPAALFSQAALLDSNVRWDLHECKSYECLNTRQRGDCLNCFNMSLEEHRWRTTFRGAPSIAQVLAMKKGALRLGLDVGGGTGSFAAHMARHGVTVMTTAFNVETVLGHNAGLPYMETIALRGLIPLHSPHQARLPLFDGVLDMIHAVNSLKYIPHGPFGELLYEWDRVLRVGGIFWFEMFYAPKEVIPRYVNAIEQLGYKKLFWTLSPKAESSEEPGEHLYLNCVLEKTPNPGTQKLDGPLPEDMDKII